jgi:EAL domain-containing protein (putative c-di-GMP-specific phosphodiesterase class I)
MIQTVPVKFTRVPQWSLVGMCRQLGIETLAEGVEASEESQACRKLGFQYMQSYFFGRPSAVPPAVSPAGSDSSAPGKAQWWRWWG